MILFSNSKDTAFFLPVGQTNDTTGDLPQDTNVMDIIVKANMGRVLLYYYI